MGSLQGLNNTCKVLRAVVIITIIIIMTLFFLLFDLFIV